jgi:SNF2-related domain/SNF2 Helicase protein/Helicase conserved C-terminal domain
VSETLEIVWHPFGVAYALLRSDDGTFSDDVGLGDRDELELLGVDVPARVLSASELAGWHPEAALGDSAHVLLAIRDLAERSVGEGLVHPELTHGGGRWYAFWGATLDAGVEEALATHAAALPAVSAEYFHGDRMAVVDDVYPRLVDQIARDRLVAAGVRLTGPKQAIRSRALESFLAGLTSPDPALPAGPTYTTLAKRVTKWVDEGLGRIVEAPWTLGLHLDERVPGGALTLELWLHAEDDPTLAMPASLLWETGAEPFAFLRDTNPYDDVATRFAQLGPFLAEHGISFDEDEPTEVDLSKDDAAFFLRELLPQLEHRGVPVLLPSAWVQAPRRIRANLTARRSSGLLSSDAIAEFDWGLAVGDVDLDEEELRRLAKLKSPVVQEGGRWHALRHEDVTRALRFLERRAAGGGIVDLVRGTSGLDTDEYGLELGDVAIDEKLAGMLDGDARFKPLPTPPGMQFALFQFQEQGHGWLRLLGDLGIGAILADDMGLGKTVQAIAMLLSERAEFGADAFGPTLVVCPMSVARQWVAEIQRFAPGLRVHLHHGAERLQGEELAEAARAADVVVTSYDLVTRDLESLQLVAWDRAILDEAQDVKNPQTKRARSLRLLRTRRQVAMTGTPIENHLGELWALMDLLNPGLLGPREWYVRTFAHPIQEDKDDAALERLQGIVRPFILRRAKDDPEVELDLPPITITKDYCRLTVEQASLYQATVDNWMPRVEAHEDRFGRRGAVLAMLGHLKQVCNHPEMLVPTGLPLDGRSGKLERLVELLGEVPQDDKALVFTQYTRFAALVPHLEERLGKEASFFHGHLNGRQRAELLEAFAGDCGPRILVISLRAGGRGLNLPAANHVFHFDRWWNPAVEQQATDRVHRLGQRKPVFVHSLICLGTLEERIDQLLESKRELVDKVMAASGEEWLGNLDLGAIRAAVALAPDAAELVPA